MTRASQSTRLNMLAFAEAGVPLIEATPLSSLERLQQEIQGVQGNLVVNWQASPELRAGGTGQTDIWLHLTSNTSLPLTCQRCMGPADTELQIDQWYRFVATEEIAMAQDDASVEDLLVMAPQFNLLDLLEDELLMALPLVPMHSSCPVVPVFSVGELDVSANTPEKPNPFTALLQLKKGK